MFDLFSIKFCLLLVCYYSSNVDCALPQTSSAQITLYVTANDPVSIQQLVVGRIHQLEQGSVLTASVTLIQDHGYYMVVDTPAATDLNAKEQMLRGLNAAKVSPGNVQFVLTSHGHPDHFSNGNFFPNSRHFFSSYEYTGNNFIKNELYSADEMKVTRNIELWNTPGHTNQDVSAIVRNVPCCGVVGVVGDLFYSESDAVGNSTKDWIADAWNAPLGMKYRAKVVCAVDWIIPGHGKIFKVTPALKTSYNCSVAAAGNGTETAAPVTSTAATTPSTLAPTTTTTLPPTTTTTATTEAPTTTATTTTPAPTTTTTTTTTSSPATTTRTTTAPNTPASIVIELPTDSPPAPTTGAPTPAAFVDLDNSIYEQPQQDDMTIVPTTAAPTPLPQDYATVDHWQYRPSNDNPVAPPCQPAYSGQIPAAALAPGPVPNGLYSVPAGAQLSHIPLAGHLAYVAPAIPCPDPRSLYGIRQPPPPPGAVIIPMMESAAANFVNYLNAPQLQQQHPPGMHYFDMIRKAFHKFTNSEPTGKIIRGQRIGH